MCVLSESQVHEAEQFEWLTREHLCVLVYLVWMCFCSYLFGFSIGLVSYVKTNFVQNKQFISGDSDALNVCRIHGKSNTIQRESSCAGGSLARYIMKIIKLIKYSMDVFLGGYDFVKMDCVLECLTMFTTHNQWISLISIYQISG